MDKFNKLIIFFLFIIKSCSDPSQESRIFSKNEEVKANSLSDNIKTKKHSLYSVILNTNNSISMTTREYLFDILKVNGTDQYQSDIDMGIDNFSKSNFLLTLYSVRASLPKFSLQTTIFFLFTFDLIIFFSIITLIL